MKSIKNYIIAVALGLTAASCSSFLEDQVPQGQLFDEQVEVQKYAEEQIISAYAVFATGEDINSSFSLWNFDVRSDDAYKGGSGPADGDVFHNLEVCQGILTTAWNLDDIWTRFYNSISRVNKAIKIVNGCDEKFTQKEQRLAELYFLRGYAHFQLKRLFKHIPFITDPDLSYNDYAGISNMEYSNDEGWGEIIKDLTNAVNVLPETQKEKGRPTKAAAAALLAKVYLYKAYHQDREESNEVTSINESDLQMVLKFTKDSLYTNHHLEADIHNNFRPEVEFENGQESIWAIQYSINDGTKYGTLNWGYALTVAYAPGIEGQDFYKPTQNLVNAFKTNKDGLPVGKDFNEKNYDKDTDNADPRLFLTVGMPGFPYMFNPEYIINESWSRSGGKYGTYVSVKHNVDPSKIEAYGAKNGPFWGNSMNRIVLRYADVMLMRAEACAQLNRPAEALKLINDIRERAAASTQMIASYPALYGVKFACKPYPTDGNYTKEELMQMVKTERRLELAMEAERFFDLVRWGDAKEVLDNYYAKEKERCVVYPKDVTFNKNKNEYLPIPHKQMSSSNGSYKQNCGGW